MADDFFRSRLDQMIDLKHPLAVLGQRLPWGQIEAALAESFQRKETQGNPDNVLCSASVCASKRMSAPV
jgi:hypothetical protein